MTINGWGSQEPVEESRGGTATASATTGDILYSDATNSLAKLAAGSDGNILTVATDIPAWEAGSGTAGWTPLASSTAAASSTVSFNSTYITSTYDVYIVVWHNLRPTADALFRLRYSPDNGSTIRATGYVDDVYSADNVNVQSSTTEHQLSKIASESTAGTGAGICYTMITNLSSSGVKTTARTWFGYRDTTDNQVACGYGRYDTAETHNYIEFSPSTSTIAVGTAYLYGLTKP